MKPIEIATQNIPPDGLDIRWTKTGAELKLTEVFTLLSPVEINAKITPQGGVYLFHGSIAATVELECARCLGKFPRSLKTQYKINYQPVAFQPVHSPKETGELELGKEEMDISYFDNERLGVGTDLREALLLALPSVHHCSEDCRGLCPQCGQNLNLAACQCQKEDHDQRWHKLTELKKHLEEK